MIKSIKKKILIGATAIAFIGSTFTTISEVEASANKNLNHNIVKASIQERKHLKNYNQLQIKEYELRFKQLGYNIYDGQSIKEFQKNYQLHANGNLSKETITLLMMVTYSQYEVELLARTIYMQSYNQPFNSQMGVGTVILNRLQHSRFPNSIHEVIRTDNNFKKVLSGKYTTMKLEDRYYQAAYKAIKGIDSTRNALNVKNKGHIKATSSISLSDTGIVTYGQLTLLGK